MLEALGHIPTQGEQFEHGDLKIEVTEMRDLKVETIMLTRVPRQK